MTENELYLPEEVADLFPDHVSQEFWDRCARHELAFQRCAACGTFRHPPSPVCHVCRSYEAEWSPVGGQGSVFSYTIVTHPVHPALTRSVPFNVVLVEFDDAPGVRLVSNLVDVETSGMHSGMVVDLVWEDLASGRSLPRFRRAG